MGAPPPETPDLPPGRLVDLPGRGRTFVRELAGPPGGPTLLLLHGWTVTADLNWYPSYAELGRHFRVVAVDHRGHGRGIRSWRPFSLEDCADDAAALAEVMGLGPVVAVGYSMGGPVAQLLWRRHPGLVSGLVLCATAASFSCLQPLERLLHGGLLALSLAIRLTPDPIRRPFAFAFARHRVEGMALRDWAAQQLAMGDPAALVQAGSAIRAFDSRPWVGGIDVPTAVVVTTGDAVVPVARQRSLATAIPGALVREVACGHGACLDDPGAFVPALVEACREVAGVGEGARR